MVWFAALAGFAFWVRRPLLREGLWTDEAISVYVASAPSASEFLARSRTSDYTPPLFNVLLAGFTRLAGSGEAALKAFALGLGLLAAAGTTALAWELGGLGAAMIGAAFAVNNPILFEMSAELRAYSLSAFLATASLVAVFRIRRRSSAPGPASCALLIAFLVALVYAHVAGGIVTAVLCGWGLWEWRRGPARPFGRALTLSALAAGASFLFWLPSTWRQARIGLPWEKELTPSESLRSFVSRTRDMLPIPGGFEQPFFIVGVAALLAVSVLLAPRVVARMRRESPPLLVTAAAAAAVWLGLGLYTAQSARYLIIPAALAAAVFAAVMVRVTEAAAAGPSRPLRVVAVFGAAALVVASFSARRDLYEGRFEVAGRPKSGLRSLCGARLLPPEDLVLVVPDYLAPTAWYYCRGENRMRGFASWSRPFLFDPGRYRAIWRDPDAASLAAARLDETLAAENRSRFWLILEQPAAGLLPFFAEPVGALTADLDRRYDMRPSGRFPGRVESVLAFVLERGPL